MGDGGVSTSNPLPAIVSAVYILLPTVLLVLGLRYGIAGVASAFVISHAIFYGIELAVLRELVAFPVPAFVAALLKPCLAAAAMVVPLVEVLPLGTLAAEFERSIKAPRFVDRRV